MDINGIDLYRIDANTGTFVTIPVVGALGIIGTLMFDANGALVGSDTLGQELFDIDTSTGVVSNVRGISLTPQGMGRMFPVPVPPVYALFGLCVLAMARSRRNLQTT